MGAANETVSQQPETQEKGLIFLTPHEIAFIDELLASVGDFGEVRLTVKNGKLRFAERVESVDAKKWEKKS